MKSRLVQVHTFGPNPGALQMFAYAPANRPANAPLVVVLHGCGQSAAGYDRGTGWTTLAERMGFVVLAPQQSQTNNPNRCFRWFEPDQTARGHGEAASIKSMVDFAGAAYGVDASRVFVTGLSAGGAMTSVMLATYPDVFAGGAIIAGLPYGCARDVQSALGSMRQPPHRSDESWGDAVRDASDHSGPWPTVSVWHGTADATVTPANAHAIVAQWANVHGASLARTDDRVGAHPRTTWRNADGREVLQLCLLTGLGHGAPINAGSGGERCGASGPFILEAGVSSSHRIADFWGLTTGSAGTERASTVEHEPGRELAVAVDRLNDGGPYGSWAAPPPEAGPAGVGAIIEGALRKAGLMK